MDELLERLKAELEEEKKRIYLARFGKLSNAKAEERRLSDFKDFN